MIAQLEREDSADPLVVLESRDWIAFGCELSSYRMEAKENGRPSIISINDLGQPH